MALHLLRKAKEPSLASSLRLILEIGPQIRVGFFYREILGVDARIP